MLTFERLSEANIARCKRWHTAGLEDWSSDRWLLATVGEFGELTNAYKKLWRIEGGMANISEADRQLSTRTAAIEKIAEEFADTFIYLNLYALRNDHRMIGEIVATRHSKEEKPEEYLINILSSLGALTYIFDPDPVEDALNSLILFALDLGFNPQRAIIDKFNATSIKYNFPERL